MTQNFNAFLALEKSKYKGKYVIMIDEKVVEKGEDIENMLHRIREKYPDKIPLVAKIPKEEVMVL
ncbi:MAG: hypothetical protein CVT88_02245 [Candidatus Altiarchaeales archaeon HGW-Altiarchaeales-1]|nr:MAG: hypothetical protein CVT89_02425 [Candidatus Altiarchaeales archaeon HGW-Altiarchaeales-2]PKP60730.1 MAG: hypothetical protein CVT88_02245 [Candidatus Altiarchaeales archaeon HGW-Altiarchaeales-1]